MFSRFMNFFLTYFEFSEIEKLVKFQNDVSNFYMFFKRVRSAILNQFFLLIDVKAVSFPAFKNKKY